MKKKNDLQKQLFLEAIFFFFFFTSVRKAEQKNSGDFFYCFVLFICWFNKNMHIFSLTQKHNNVTSNQSNNVEIVEKSLF